MITVFDLFPKTQTFYVRAVAAVTGAGALAGTFGALASGDGGKVAIYQGIASGSLGFAVVVPVALWASAAWGNAYWQYMDNHAPPLEAPEPEPVEEEAPKREWAMPPGMRLENGHLVKEYVPRGKKDINLWSQTAQITEHIGQLEVKDDKEGMTFRMNVNKAVWIFARNWDAAQHRTTEAVWVGLKAFQSVYYFRATREWMIAQNIGRWKNPEVPRSGWELTRGGTATINFLRGCAKCPYPDRFEAYSRAELR